jgi:hypothetical protein
MLPEEWEDPDVLGRAYDALRKYNNNEMWWNWRPLPFDDPMSRELRRMRTPPMPLLESMGEEEYYEPAPEEELGMPGQMGLTDQQWETLPRWQRMLISTLESPYMGGAMGALPGGLIGLALGGPVGGGIGLLAGGAVGAYAQQHPEGTLASALMYLDLPAEWIEQTLGTVYQIATPAEDKPEWGDWDELQKWLSAARQASSLFYTVGGTVAQEGKVPFDIANLFAELDVELDPWIDWLARDTAILSPGWETKLDEDLVVAESGEIWKFGEPLPVKVEGDTAAVLLDARTRILAGEQPEKIIQEYMEKYGASGQLRELVGHIVIDPLTVVPAATGRVGAFTAGKLGKVELATAFATTHGITEAVQKYGTILRATKPVTELSEASAFTRWLTGVTKTGELKVLAPATEGGGLFRYLLGMKPSSRATEVVNTAALNLGVILSAVDGNEDDLIRIIKSLADTPDEVARELSMRSILSPDGAAIPMFLKDFGETADELLLKFKSTAWQRKLLANLAEVTGKTDSEVLQMISNASDAEVLLRQFVDAAREKGGGAAKNIVAAYDDARAPVSQLPPEEQLNGAKLQEMVKIFIDDELPHNLEVFKSHLYAAAMDKAAEWAADWFGVTPDPAWVRTSHMVKSAQSLLLLGLNPTYFANNIMNNTLTAAATGVFGIRSAKTIDKIWARAGLEPPRLRAGIGPVALGTEISYAPIRKAMDAPGLLTDVTRFFNEKTRKFQIFSNLSMKGEQLASAQAYTSGFVQFMARHWNEGVGFSRMPAPLERALGQINPELPKLVYGAIKGGMNQAEIEKALWSGLTRRSLDGAIPSLAERLRAAGTNLTEADIRELLSHSGVDEMLREKLRNAKSDADVRRAFNETNQVVQDRLDRMVAQDLERTAAEVAGRIRGGEGFPAVLELFDNQQLEFTERWFENFAEWEKAFQDTLNMDYASRNVVMQATAASERQKWQRYYTSERTKLQGIIKGLGIEGSDNRRIIDLVDQGQRNHNDFFDLRNRKNREFFNTKFDNATERQVAWDTLQSELLEAYKEMTSKELHIQDKLDEEFLVYLEERFGLEAREAGGQWRVGVGEIRQNMVDEMGAFRDALRTMPADERRPAWLTFLHGRDGYIEQIGNLFRKNVDGAHELYNRLRGRGGAEPTELGIPPPGGPEPPAGPPPPAPEGVAIPIMVTHGMRAAMRQLGYSDDAIRKLNPNEIWEIIQKSELGEQIAGEVARGAPEPEAVAPAPETPLAPAPEAPGPVQDLSPVGRKVQLTNLETGVVAGQVLVEEGAAFVPVKMDKTNIVAWVPMEDVKAFEAPRQPVEVPQTLVPPPRAVSAENARLAAKHGIPLLDEEGSFLPGAEIHFRHAVRKYGGPEAEFIDRTTPLSDIPNELAAKAMEERARVKAEEAAKPDELLGAVEEFIEEHEKFGPPEEVTDRVQEIDDIVVRGDWDDLPEEIRSDLDEAIGEMAAEVDIAEPGYKIFTEVEGQGGTPEVTGVKSTYPDWWDNLGTKFYRDAEGTKFTAKAAVQQVLHDLTQGTVNPKNKAGDDYKLVTAVKAALVDYLEPKRGYQIYTGKIDVTKWFRRLDDIGADVKRVFIWDNPEKVQGYLNEVNEIVAELSPYNYEDIKITLDSALSLQEMLMERIDELGRIPPEELAQMVDEAQRLARIELSSFESRKMIRDYQMRQGVEPSELFQDPKQAGFWEAGEETPLFTGAAQRGKESVFRPEEAPVQGMMPGFEPQLKGAKPGGEASGPLFDAAAQAGLFRRQIRQKIVDYLLSEQPEVLSGAWDAQLQADNAMALMDAHANVWAKYTGREPYEWYAASIADITTQPVDATNDPYLLGQIAANKQTEGYRAFAAGNKVVDGNGDLLVVYHGTTHEFRVFDPARGEAESWLGQAIYATDSIDDVNANYAGYGPDLTSRIDNLAERIAQEIELDADSYPSDTAQFFGMTLEDFWERLDSGELTEMIAGDMDGLSNFIARKQIAGENQGLVMPLHMRMENPAYLEPSGGTYLDFMDVYRADLDYIADELQWNPESYLDEIRDYYGYADDWEPDDLAAFIDDDRYEIAEGMVVDIEDTDYGKMEQAIRYALYELDVDTYGETSESLMAKIVSEHPEGDYLDNIIDTIKNRTDLVYAQEHEEGKLAASAIIGRMIKNMGYDGVILDAGTSFPRMEGTYGAKHYIVWEPNQVKSVFNMGDFNMTNPDIYYQRSFPASPAQAGDGPWYFSPLKNLVQEKMPGRMKVEQLQALIRKGGIKADELKWTGLDDWLEEKLGLVEDSPAYRIEEYTGARTGRTFYRVLNQNDEMVQTMPNRELAESWVNRRKGMVTKDEILKFLDENEVHVQEVVKGEPVELPPDFEQRVEATKLDLDTLREGEYTSLRSQLADAIYELTEPDGWEAGRAYDAAVQYMHGNQVVANWVIDHIQEKYPGLLDRAHDAGQTLLKYQEELREFDQMRVPEPTQYAPHTLHGAARAEARNYRELLLTWNQYEKIPDTRGFRLNRDYLPWEVSDNVLQALIDDELLTLEGALKALEEDFNKLDYNKDLTRVEKYRTLYRSGHWQEPNVLAHVRYSDTVDVYGRKVLYIDEVQSDWQQAARTQGIIEPPTLEDAKVALTEAWGLWDEYDVARKRVSELSEKALLMSGESVTTKYLVTKTQFAPGEERVIGIFDTVTEARAALREYMLEYPDKPSPMMHTRDTWTPEYEAVQKALNKARNKELATKVTYREYVNDVWYPIADFDGGGVTPAPFAKTWQDLAMKRMLRWAAEKGYDRITWSTGKIQNERWNLAQYFSKIEWEKNIRLADDVEQISLRTYDLNGDTYNTITSNPENLSDFVGNDIARKIIDDPESTGVLHGEGDLAVGSQGMQFFYDQLIPKGMKKVGKKWGVAPETDYIFTGIPGFEGIAVLDTTNSFIKVARDKYTGIWDVLKKDDLGNWNMVAGGKGRTPREALDAADWKNLEIVMDKNYTEVHGMDITPEMRQSILRGQPLFDQKKGAVQFLNDGRAMIYALQSPDISTVVHELGHIFRMDLRRMISQATDDAVRAQLMTDFETASKWAGVVQDADGEFLWSGEANHRFGMDSDQYRAAITAEEKFARGFEEYLMLGTSPSPELIPVFEKFKEWLAHIYARLKGQIAGVTPEMKQVYDRLLVEYPEVADYTITTEMGRARVPTQGSMFQPSPPANSENFRNWFLESKVVDADGSPMPVYHGTRGEFEAFQPDYSSDFGFHFGTTEQAARRVGTEVIPDTAYPGANIHEVYLSIQNPLRVRDFSWQGEGLRSMVAEHLDVAGWSRVNELLQQQRDMIDVLWAVRNRAKRGGPQLRSYLNTRPRERSLVSIYAQQFGSSIDEVYSSRLVRMQFQTWLAEQLYPARGERGFRQILNDAIIEEFERLGYDGLVYENRIEGQGDSWVAFRPEQVKSVRNSGEWSPVDPRMLHQGVPLEYENGYNTRMLFQDDIPDPDLPLGEVQSNNPSPPLGEMQDEAFRNHIKPILNNLEGLMTGPDAQVPSQVANLDTALDPGTMNQLRAYMGGVYGELGDTKLAGVRWAENRRDAALLNYSRRYGFDNFLTAIFPYQFWYTRTAAQWALRFIDKPAWMAQYARLRNFQRNTIQQPGFPRRLLNKVRIPVPFLPEWAGGGLYMDPFRQVFPFEQFARPWEQRASEQNQIEKRAMSLIERWGEDGDEDPQETKDALDFRAGPLWEKAINTAKLDVESETGNPWDFINLIMSPSLPIQWGSQWMRGQKDQISQLPATRLIQNVSGALGANQGRGFNIEGPLRRTLGLPEYDRYYDYNIDRAISDMIAEGALTPEEGELAMVDQAGDAYLRAQQRVAQEKRIEYLGAPLGADLFPEGEQRQRALKLEYDKAREAWLGGQEGALTDFFDKYPEYSSRMQLFMDDPEERLRFFLRSSIWEAWFNLPELHQKQLVEQLGDPFTQAFLNKDTRSYDAIDTPTLAQWARVMKGVVPETAPETPEAQVELAGEEETAAYQAFVEERDKRFPNIGELLQIMYEAPEEDREKFRRQYPWINDYYKWRNQQFAEHPEILPYALSEKSEMHGVPQDIQVLYYQYQTQRDKMFPAIFDIQEQYFSLPKQQRKAFRQQHPELPAYWEWRREFMRQYPNLIPYIMSEESLAEAVLGEDSGGSTSQRGYSGVDISLMDPALVRMLNAHYMFGEPLGDGAQKALQLMWENLGKPGKNFSEFIDDILAAEF